MYRLFSGEKVFLSQLVGRSFMGGKIRPRRSYFRSLASLVLLSPQAQTTCSGIFFDCKAQQQQQQLYQQRRWVTSKKRQRQLARAKGEDAFVVLGVSRADSYGQVKKTFVRIAMRHHPDTSASKTPEEQEEHKEKFLAARKAFEAIVEGPDGLAILKTESDDYDEEEDLDAWFKAETGHDMPFMDAQTMKEVAEMTECSDIGLDRDGGMWTLAKMVTQSVRSGGDGRDVLRLEAGTVRDRNIDGILRRRRRR